MNEDDEAHGGAGERRWPTRRSVLVAGAAGLVTAGLALSTDGPAPPLSDQPAQRAAGVTATAAPSTAANAAGRQAGYQRIEQVYSKARGRKVNLVLNLPTRSPAPGLPIALLLHGLHGTARYAPTGLLRQLATDVTHKNVPPFGFVALDGGDNYWHQAHPGDDPMAMLLDEVPKWLKERGLGGADGVPFAASGWSMGGFGAMLYTKRRLDRKQPPEALATLAPALITSWAEMSKRHIFPGPADWAATDPLRYVTQLKRVPTGIWCGTEDPFITGYRKFVAQAHPQVAYAAHGVHGDVFNRSVVPSLIAFLGKHVPRTV